MGSNQSIVYGEPVSEKFEDSTPVYRHPKFKEGDYNYP